MISWERTSSMTPLTPGSRPGTTPVPAQLSPPGLLPSLATSMARTRTRYRRAARNPRTHKAFSRGRNAKPQLRSLHRQRKPHRACASPRSTISAALSPRKAAFSTPPAYGTVGNANRNVFPRCALPQHIDFSVQPSNGSSKNATPRSSARSSSMYLTWLICPVRPHLRRRHGTTGSVFGCGCAVPDVAGNNPVLGSGGPRHIQFGLKLGW